MNIYFMKKTIHIYSQYYYPVSNACSNRIGKYVKALKDKYDIQVITWMPNYPDGIKTPKYKRKLFQKEIWLYNEKIIRTYEFATKNSGFFLRSLNYLSFMTSCFFYGLFSKKPDKIIVTSPPLFTALSVLGLYKLRKIPYILEIRDLWPDSVVALWFMKKESLSYKVFSYLEKSLYKNASKIIWVTKWICKEIENKWVTKDKIVLQYNVFDSLEIHNENNPYITYKNKIKWRKISLFAWNMNEAYDFKKTNQFITKNNDIYFVFIWDWSQCDFLKNNTKNLDNILFLDRITKNKVDEFLYYSDMILVPLKDEEFYKWTFPVKWIEWIVNNKEIIFFWPKDWEFNLFLEKYKKLEEDISQFSFNNFKSNIKNLISKNI